MTEQDDKLAAMLRKVQGLLAKAESTTFPAEAESLRAAAEALMLKYRIDETQLATGQPTSSLVPRWHTMPVVAGVGGEWTAYYNGIAGEVLRHFGLPYKILRVRQDDGSYWTVAEFVGYDSDARMADVLYTCFRMAFSGRLEPKYDPNLSDQENAYAMRMAGMEGRRIAMAIYGRDDKSLRPKVRKMFADEAVRRGEDPSVLLGQGNSVKNYRESYATGFYYEVGDRLRVMRSSRGESEKGLELASRGAAIKSLFEAKYPPPPPVTVQAYVDPRENCERCKKAASGYCREHLYLKPRAARGGGASVNWSGYSAGKAAARMVDLGRGGTPKANPSTRKEIQ